MPWYALIIAGVEGVVTVAGVKLVLLSTTGVLLGSGTILKADTTGGGGIGAGMGAPLLKPQLLHACCR